jgi:hypothetical protein
MDQQGEPARSVRGASSAYRVPRVLRARRVRLAWLCLPRLLIPPPTRLKASRSFERATQRSYSSTRATSAHRALEDANELADAAVHHHRHFDTDFGVDWRHGTNAFIRDGDRRPAPISSTAAETRRWGAPELSDMTALGVRKSGKIRRRATSDTAV